MWTMSDSIRGRGIGGNRRYDDQWMGYWIVVDSFTADLPSGTIVDMRRYFSSEPLPVYPTQLSAWRDALVSWS